MTPYEMRFNYVHFANDYLQSRYRADVERITLSYPDIEQPEVKQALDRLQYPTSDDIFSLAEKIKEFADSK